ncbi:MAG: hypothetical protein WDN06_20925 [Asticcacaulis sp.]
MTGLDVAHDDIARILSAPRFEVTRGDPWVRCRPVLAARRGRQGRPGRGSGGASTASTPSRPRPCPSSRRVPAAC